MATLLDDFRRRLRPPEPADALGEQAPDDRPEPAQGLDREVEFAAYAEDCRVFGFVRLPSGRMSETLNDASDYLVSDVMVVRLDDGLAIQAVDTVVKRDEVLAIRAAGSRGDPARRTRRRPYPVTLKTGPYLIHGYLHELPGADPLQGIRRRKPMVPLTEAWIEYRTADQNHRARVGTILVNHELWDWIRLSRDEEVALPGLPAEMKPDPRAKDMTGHIRSEGAGGVG